MNATPDAWDIATFADTVREMPTTTPALTNLAAGDIATTDQNIAAVQNVVAAATAADLPAYWHQDNPDEVGEPIYASIRLPQGRVIAIFPRVDRDGRWWFEVLHFTPQGMADGDWDQRRAKTVAEVITIAQDWKDNPPA